MRSKLPERSGIANFNSFSNGLDEDASSFKAAHGKVPIVVDPDDTIIGAVTLNATFAKN